jgi:uncharacterized membrane protein YeaQ/YmgE (transglycosylase-associated protein family)
MDLLTWLFVGLVAGYGASRIINGTGLGIVGDILVGIGGAVVGGFLVQKLQVQMPVHGLLGVILVALAGAIVLLAAVRFLKSLMKR